MRVIDLFCGAGGATTGAIAAGCNVVYALNHWPMAIDSHKANHPGVKHRCAPIDRVNPREDVPACDILIAGPECTHHSNARGGRPVEEQRRATGWDVVRWAEVLRPRWIVVENVREFLSWGPIGCNGRPLKSKKGEIFDAWCNSIRALGYKLEWKLLNSADYGAATKRIRLFVIARRGPSTKPIPFPKPTHTEDQWKPAADIVDWNKPCPSIFTRKRPLADKTLRRIEIGLKKFVEPFIVPLRNNNAPKDSSEPLDTITAGGNQHGLAVPFLVAYHGGTDPNRDGTERQHSLLEPLPTIDTQNRYGLATPFIYSLIGRAAGNSKSINKPLPTIVAARENHGVIMPFLLPRQGFYDHKTDKPCRSVEQPLGTITANHCPAHLVYPYLIDVNHGDGKSKNRDRSYSLESPLNTITGKREKAVCLPFFTEYYGSSGARSVDDPLSTVTSKPHHGLTLVKTMQELGVVDIGFRMLEVDELAAATGFPADYWLAGNKADQVRQVGNAIPPAFVAAICREIKAYEQAA